MKRILNLMLILSFAGCSAGINSNIQPNNLKERITIKGQAVFPKINRPSIKIFATMDNLLDNAVISLIVPATQDTIATGLSNADGTFELDPVEAIANDIDKIYYLDAQKRLGFIAAPVITLRTVVSRTAENRWNIPRYLSVTNGYQNPQEKTYINTTTTAVAIADLLAVDLDIENTIGTVNKDVLSAELSPTATVAGVNNIKNKVETNITNDIDPLSDATYSF